MERKVNIAEEFQSDVQIRELDKDVILICGKAGAGKGEASKILTEFYERNDMVADEIAMADVMREVARRLGWNGEKTPLFRKFMQRFGTDVCRNILGEDIWINIWFQLAHKSPADVIIVNDVRFDNEVEVIREYAADSLCMRIVGKEDGYTDYNHESEQGISSRLIQAHIVNDYGPKFRKYVTAEALLLMVDVEVEV